MVNIKRYSSGTNIYEFGPSFPSIIDPTLGPRAVTQANIAAVSSGSAALSKVSTSLNKLLLRE